MLSNTSLFRFTSESDFYSPCSKSKLVLLCSSSDESADPITEGSSLP